MPMNALFYHGWGFDSSLWAGLAERLTGWRIQYDDRGYFGKPHSPLPDGPCLAVTHSYGTMRALINPPPHCIGIVAINGFDRFVAGDTSSGVHPRILRRMIEHFEIEPKAVLQDFRLRCGSMAPFPAINAQALGDDLRNLGLMDCSDQVAALNLPILSIQGGTDPILPSAMRETVFSKASRLIQRSIPGGGHLLPLTEADECGRTIREFARVLA